MRRFEKVGLTRAQAEQVTEILTDTICMNKVKITEQFVSKAALERVSSRASSYSMLQHTKDKSAPAARHIVTYL